MLVNTTGMKLIRNSGNWDLYIDSDGIIWSKALAAGCKDSYWGNARHYKKIFGEELKINK